MLNRRRFLAAGGLGAAGLGMAGLGLPRIARADDLDPAAMRMVVVYNYGGWDPTRVFATEFENRAFDMERQAGLSSRGGVGFVDHPNRPSVAGFFDRHHERTLILNGVLVSSVAHENCLKLSLTGTSADGSPDWPAVLAGERVADFALPHLVVGGPSFPGQMGSAVTRAGSSGQLEGLLSGDILDRSDAATSAPDRRSEDVMDAYLKRRASAAASGAPEGRSQELTAAYANSLERGSTLKGLLHVMDWSGGTDLTSQAGMAVDALSMGISRCVTLGYSGSGWDTHTNNNQGQSRNFEGLFSGVSELLDLLRATPGPGGDTLADQTLVVVMSEMGRTPKLNDGDGKDHWPYTSMMLVGPGITGDRVIGGFDSYGMGRLLDFDSGEVDRSNGRELDVRNVGATLLQMAGVDPELYHPGVPTVGGLLA
jgi:uncharacterized protein (DUF1501 family)